MPNDQSAPIPEATYETRLARLRHTLRQNLPNAPKIVRQLLMSLHERGFATIQEIYEEAALRGDEGDASPAYADDPNAAMARNWTAADEAAIREIVAERAARHFADVEMDDLVNLVLKREKARGLEDIANLPHVPSRLLVAALKDFCSLPVGGLTLRPAEVLGTRVALLRHFVSDSLDFIKIAKHRFTIRFMNEVVERIVCTEKGSGRIGGKAAGLLLARSILETREPDDPIDYVNEVFYPESWFVAADVCEAFITLNGLGEYRSHKYKSMDEIRAQSRVLREIFRNSAFPPDVVARLRQILEQVGEAPLIVRSSSLLEDSFGSAFAGKYDSIFLGNQGSLDDRLRALTGAIGEVYSTIYGPDPIEYRRRRGLIDYDESMGILIQKVVGRRYHDLFLPLYAGVAFSRNDLRWSKRIRREDGMARLVFGLGTRAVDRVANDYPRLVPLGMPTLRPEVTMSDLRTYSQKIVDAMAFDENRLVHLRKDQVLKDGSFPGLHHVISTIQDGALSPPLTRLIDLDNPSIITFDGMVRDGTDVKRISAILKKLERVYGCPVDIEFAHDGERFYLLQCRPQAQRIELERVRIPRNVPPESWVFTANRYVPNAHIPGIEYVLIVDPADYDRIPSYEEKSRVARLVGALNQRLAGQRFILMGPGRWGSNNLDLGIKVRYADISHTRMLIEIARMKNGMVPDVSFGTHFFQDLVEGNIQHLALFPEQPGVYWNTAFLQGSANCLAEVLPTFVDLAAYARLIHVPSVAGGRTLTIAMDGEDEQALAYLE